MKHAHEKSIIEYLQFLLNFHSLLHSMLILFNQFSRYIQDMLYYIVLNRSQGQCINYVHVFHVSCQYIMNLENGLCKIDKFTWLGPM